MKTQLVQHVTQLSVILRAVPKVAPEIPAWRIGFHLAPGWTGAKQGTGRPTQQPCARAAVAALPLQRMKPFCGHLPP
jgi:hypothetical protein